MTIFTTLSLSIFSVSRRLMAAAIVYSTGWSIIENVKKYINSIFKWRNDLILSHHYESEP